MADAIIDLVGPEELPLVGDLYNKIFRPTRDLADIRQRFRGCHNVVMLVARLNDKPVGFFVGFELKPGVFFAWFCGVIPEMRRQGIASQLTEAAQSWAKLHDYETIRFECQNQHRPLLHMALNLGYDIVGIRWDSDHGDNVVVLEKSLHD
ncbi:MAG: GNAT family N-acetyltransferase [Planctomycetes bacterium]|nr:GNAT family N-acetyltransferase [Planctomycetota bacterium]